MAEAMTSPAAAETLDILEEDERQGVLGNVADAIERSPLIVFGCLSAIALVIIVGAVWFFRSRGAETLLPPPLDAGAIVAARSLQTQGTTLAARLAGEDAFQEALHPLLSLEEIRQAEVPKGFLGEEILRLKQVDLALSVDPREAIRRAPDHAAAYDNLLETLIGLDQASSISAGRIVDEQQILKERIATQATNENAATARLNASLAGSTAEVDKEALSDLVTARETRAQLTARLALLQDIRDRYPDAVLSLRARIAGMKANREILIQDLTAIDVDRAGLDIIRRASPSQYYDPALGIRVAELQGDRTSFGSTASTITIPSSNGGSTSGSQGSSFAFDGGGLGATPRAPTYDALGMSGLHGLQLVDGGSGTVPQIVLR